MTLAEFFSNVEVSPELKGLGIEQGTDHLVVLHKESGKVTVLSTNCIQDNDWGLLNDVLCFRREPHSLTHFTRVVGYFSRVENWNKSKIGELKDRHKGTYALSEETQVAAAAVSAA
jgi:hypothetical protein